jgi:hypothetical protein
LFFLVCHSRRESAVVLVLAVAVAFVFVFAVVFAVAVACSLFVIPEGNLLLLLSLPLSGKRQRRVLYSA